MKNTADVANGAYDPGAHTGPIRKILASQRRKMFDAFMAFQQGGSLLSVGVAPNSLFDKPDYLSAWSDTQERVRITPYLLEQPAMARLAEELRLPFKDGQFDWVFCNECIEHAGDRQGQYRLVSELYRVARKGVFITTSNRKHPIEFNTGLPFIHLLSEPWRQRLLRWSGKRAWAEPGVLNLLDAQALYRFASALPGSPEHDVGHKRVFGIKAHFFLMIRKPGT